MKEKIIEKRVMKMKKVFVTLLMLMMVVGLFAESKNDTAKVTATVGAVNEAWFAGQAGTTSAPSNPVEKTLNNAEGKLDGTVIAEIWAVVDTNVPTGCEVSISGTALTLMESTTEPIYSSENYVALEITANMGGEPASVKKYEATTPATGKPVGNIDDTPIKITITPKSIKDGSGIAEQKLTIQVKDGVNNEKLDKLTAGEYWSWLIMTYSSNA